jgi:transposase
MTMDILTLTFWQKRRLEEQLRETHDARIYRRTLAILEVASGEAVASVARRLRVTPRSIYHWVAAYSRDPSPAALVDADRCGRPALLSELDRDRLRRLLADSPQAFGYPNAVWTVPLLRQHLQRSTGFSPSEDTIRRELQRLDYTWKRPRYRLDPDPEARGKKEADSAANPSVAAAQRGAGRGRDRPAAVPAAAVVLVACRPAHRGGAVRPERPAGGVRGDELADGLPAVLAARTAAGRGLSGVP